MESRALTPTQWAMLSNLDRREILAYEQYKQDERDALIEIIADIMKDKKKHVSVGTLAHILIRLKHL